MSPPAYERPRIGLGTAPGPRQSALDLEPALHAAIDAGCGLYDTAEVYGSESLLGRMLGRRGVDRDAVELVTKLWQTNHAPEHVLAACQGSLVRLAVDVIDLYLVHAPESWRFCGPLEVAPEWTRETIDQRVVPRDGSGAIVGGGVPLPETWEAMLELPRRGLARGVGLANVGQRELAELDARGLEPPRAIEVEIHPLRPQPELRTYCRERGIRILAQTPLATGELLAHPLVRRLAGDLGTTAARVVLRWHLDRGLEPIPGSGRPEHVRANLAPLPSPLPPEAAAALDGLAGATAC